MMEKAILRSMTKFVKVKLPYLKSIYSISNLGVLRQALPFPKTSKNLFTPGALLLSSN